MKSKRHGEREAELFPLQQLSTLTFRHIVSFLTLPFWLSLKYPKYPNPIRYPYQHEPTMQLTFGKN